MSMSMLSVLEYLKQQKKEKEIVFVDPKVEKCTVQNGIIINKRTKRM
ncbi:TPA: hypothetical protein ACIZC1_002567 [Enterococcus faecalis]